MGKERREGRAESWLYDCLMLMGGGYVCWYVIILYLSFLNVLYKPAKSVF